MSTRLARITGCCLQGVALGVLFFVAALLLWSQTGDSQGFQYQGF